MRIHRLFLCLALVLAAALPALADTWVVDDDGVQCPDADFDTFQAAYAAAAAGDTIRLCKGAYFVQDFVIDKALTIVGPQQGIDARGRMTDNEAVFTTPSGLDYCIEIWADGVTIDGVYFGGMERAIGLWGAGPDEILRNVTIRNTVFWDLYEALWFDRGSENCVIERNWIYGNESGFFKTLIFFEGNGKTHVGDRIVNNDIEGAPWGYGIYNGYDSYVSGMTIAGNKFFRNYTSILMQVISESTIENNCFEDNSYAGLMAAMHGVTVARNTFVDNDVYPQENPPGSGNYWAFGLVLLDDIYGDPPSDNVTVENNTFSNNIVGLMSLANVETDTIAIHGNCFFDNAVNGVRGKDAYGALDATGNWWGSADGPYHPTSWLYLGSPYGPNPGGGDAVTNYVLYDGWLTEQPNCPTCCADADGDGYQDASCGGTDCDDTDADVHPGAAEVCDGIDNNCADGVDEEPYASDSCANGVFCDGEETCSAGECAAGTPVACGDGLYCNGAEFCDEDADSCAAGTPVACDNGLYCDGVEFCNEDADSCAAGTPVACDNGLYCDGVESCDEGSDACVPGTPVLCNDGLYCDGVEFCNEATDACDAGTPVNCDNGLYCDGVETCDEAADACAPGAPVVCAADDLFCNGAEVCDEAADACGHTGDPCGSGYFCCEASDTCEDDADADGYNECTGDCNDADPTIHIGAPEVECDEIDQDCDGLDYCPICDCPTLTSIDVTEGEPGDVITVTIHGRFPPCAGLIEIWLKPHSGGAPHLFLQNQVIVNETTITGQFVIPDDAPCGQYDLWLFTQTCFDVIENAFTVECPPPAFACPKTIGFWKQQVQQSPARKYTLAEINMIVAAADALTPVFSSSADLKNALLYIGNNPLAKAKRQFAAFALNLAAYGLLGVVGYPAGMGPNTPLNLSLTPADTVGEAFHEVEGYILTQKKLGLANDLADAINNGNGVTVNCNYLPGTTSDVDTAPEPEVGCGMVPGRSDAGLLLVPLAALGLALVRRARRR